MNADNVSIIESIKKYPPIQKILKTKTYSRIRQYFPQKPLVYTDDRALLETMNPAVVRMDWPDGVDKPVIGLVRDFELFPRWTKYVRFLENNHFTYRFYNIHSTQWIEKAKLFDMIVGIPSSFRYHLDEIHRKTYILEKHLGKFCYPSSEHAFLYDDKRLEAFVSQQFGFPFAKTLISSDRDETLRLIEHLKYPVVSKVDGSSASVGVELIPDLKSCRKLVHKIFSTNGRKSDVNYYNQKNYIYLQEFIPNDGYDLRVILIENHAFGFYRNVPKGDFRASGMDHFERRELPAEAILLVKKMNEVIKSPQLVVDIVHGLDGKFHIVEYAPQCKIRIPFLLMVNDEPGVYIIEEDETIHFEKGTYWVQELALKAALNQYLQWKS